MDENENLKLEVQGLRSLIIQGVDAGAAATAALVAAGAAGRPAGSPRAAAEPQVCTASPTAY